ncbi:hypothetical protein BVIET440_40097 [Burkholderia vietnamiensis]|nr:hypothetical protein BVI2075_30002 [Burkholderia vietnamiensis]CAG9201427.1 hypothetical protein BVI1335_1550002 [Burkholderia vietnamiensis]CAG9230246.1 hypothetical protein BVI434_680013 [Burkholderia vietnamiensis]
MNWSRFRTMPESTPTGSDRGSERTFNNQIANKEEYGNVEENRPRSRRRRADRRDCSAGNGR